MERALLVRHAESVFSERGLANGRVDVRCPLSVRGEEQARALAVELEDEDIDLCATSELERARQTANIALTDKAVPRIVLAELNDPLYGRYEGGPLESYLAWALANDSAADPPGGGERRQRLVARYATAFRKLLGRPEQTILIVTHSLPVAYVRMALAGQDPAPRVPLVEYAKIHAVAVRELEQAVTRLESWCGANLVVAGRRTTFSYSNQPSTAERNGYQHSSNRRAAGRAPDSAEYCSRRPSGAGLSLASRALRRTR